MTIPSCLSLIHKLTAKEHKYLLCKYLVVQQSLSRRSPTDCTLVVFNFLIKIGILGSFMQGTTNSNPLNFIAGTLEVKVKTNSEYEHA